ncbi:ATP-binding protein [Streptosporangium subroseum]|uniref:ATP-binding protein n=1 Tax=Streptosporangium subroseum TaxID=106412 RepID=UPI0030845C49
MHHRATDAGSAEERLEDLLLAANEAAVNVLEHGGGSGTLTVWHDETELTFDVVDTTGRLVPQDVHHWRSSHQAGRSNPQRSSRQNIPAACGYDLDSVLERNPP